MSPTATGGLPRTTVGNGGGPVTTSLATNGMKTDGLESLRGTNRVYPHLSDLVKVKVDVDLQNTPIRTLLQKGEAFAKQADTHLDFKRPDFALQEYVKALTVVTALPRHKDWPTVQADRGDLHRLSTGLNKRVDGQHEKFEAVKKLIQENNLRSGVKPTSQNGSAQFTQANTHSRSHSTLSTYTNGSSAPSTDGSHHTVETNGTSRSSTPSITPENAPVLRKKPAPPIQPKPDALHGKAINSLGNKSTNTSQVDLLAARFARLRGSESPTPGQDPRIRTHPISIPDNPGVVSHAIADKSQDPAQSPKPINRPLGPREMPSVPSTPFQSSNTRPLINVNIPTMPKAPDAIYSPARGSDSAATINLPSSNPRGSYVRSSSRQNSVSSIPKNYVSTPLSADDGREYFSPAHAMENYSYKPSKKKSQEPLYPPDKLDITAGELVNLLKVSSILLVDIRTRAEFDSGHIMTQRIICVEPMTIRPDMSAEELEESMVLAPDAEQDLFKQRQDFDLIVYYNQSSCHPNAYDSKGTYKTALEDFCKAVYDYGYDKKPARRPILLYGGLDAWMDVIGPASLTSSQTGAASLNTSLRRSIRPAGKVPMARDPRRLVDYRKKAYQSRLRPEEESKWDEVLQENPGSPNPNPDYVTTTDDFFRRFPAINLQESMVAPISDHASRRLDEAHQKELTSMMPPPPARPPPALPRQSFSGVSERTSGGLAMMTAQGTDPSQTSSISKHVVPPGLTGLANFGNTCYMNSVMQCLSATTPIRKFLENYHYPDNRPPRKGNETSDPPQLMIRNVGNLFRYLWSGQYVYVTPSTFKNYVFRLHSNRGTKENQATFGGPNQQDAHEFLEWSLEIMNDELNPYRNITETGDTEEEEKMRNKQHRLEVAHSWWQKRRSSEGSILTNYLEGAEMNEIRCRDCNSISRRNQPFSILTVPIPEHVDRIVLQEQIKKNWDVEHLEDFGCPGCKGRETSYRQRKICRLPPWLIIQISFFRFGARGPEKRYVHVDFPKYKGELLDMTSTFIQAGPNDPHIPDLDSGIKGPFRYECYGIVRHSGHSANSGHYRAQVYHEQEKGMKNWYTYDDTRVRQASKSELDTNTLGEPYLLFYKRQTFGMA